MSRLPKEYNTKTRGAYSRSVGKVRSLEQLESSKAFTLSTSTLLYWRLMLIIYSILPRFAIS
jgi:hypothetical protein